MKLQNPDVLKLDDVGYCMDNDGKWFRWKHYPVAKEDEWLGKDAYFILEKDAPKDLPEDFDWKNSWVDNPNYIKSKKSEEEKCKEAAGGYFTEVPEVRMTDESKLPDDAIGYCMNRIGNWFSFIEKPRQSSGRWNGEGKNMIYGGDYPKNIPEDFDWKESWVERKVVIGIGDVEKPLGRTEEILDDYNQSADIEDHGSGNYIINLGKTAPVFDEVNKAKHYNLHPSGVECIDVIEHYQCNVAMAMKYLWRCDHKHVDPTIDLKKAEYYVKREIALRSKS